MSDFFYYLERDEEFLSNLYIYLSRLEGAYKAQLSIATKKRDEAQKNKKKIPEEENRDVIRGLETRMRYYDMLSSIVRTERETVIRRRLQSDIAGVKDVTGLLDFIDMEIAESQRILTHIVRDFPDRKTFIERITWFLDRYYFKREKVKSLVGQYQDFTHVYTFVATRPVERTRHDNEGKILRDPMTKRAIKDRIERKLEAHIHGTAILTAEVQEKIQDVLRDLVEHYQYRFIYEESNVLEEATAYAWTLHDKRSLTEPEEENGTTVSADLYDHTYSKTIFKLYKVLSKDWYTKDTSDIVKMIL